VTLAPGDDRPAAGFAGWLRAAHACVVAVVGWKRPVLAAVLGAVAVAALPPIYLWVALVAAFTGLVWLIDAAKSLRAAFLAGWWFGLGYFVFGLYWIANALLTKPEEFGWLAPLAVLALSALMALFPAAAAAVTKASATVGVGRVLVFAAAWTAFEWVRSWAFSGFPWNLIGSVWTFSDAMMQVTAVVGTYGLGLITVAVAAMPAALLASDPSLKRRFGHGAGIFAAAVAALVLIWVGGAIRLALAGPAESVPGVRLRLVQPNIAQTEKWKPDLRTEHFLRQLRMGALPADLPPTDVVWPEAAVPFFLAEHRDALALLGEATPPGGLTIVGALRRAPPDQPAQIWNSLLAVDDGGRVIATYDKSHLVPYGEYVPFRSLLGIASVAGGGSDFSPGAGVTTLALPGLPPVSPLICYEVIFPAEVADRDRRPQWLLNLTNDGWYGQSTGPYQHFAMARLRAVEEGLPLVRVANTGISAIVDPYGRVRDELPLAAAGILDGELPVALADRTVYARWGNAVVLLLVAATAVVGLLASRWAR
jgi:apolipoprotein N-acyltransferase